MTFPIQWVIFHFTFTVLQMSPQFTKYAKETTRPPFAGHPRGFNKHGWAWSEANVCFDTYKRRSAWWLSISCDIMSSSIFKCDSRGLFLRLKDWGDIPDSKVHGPKGYGWIGYCTHYIILIFDPTHYLDLFIFQVKFSNSCVSGADGSDS